jgi:hypothetical protein
MCILKIQENKMNQLNDSPNNNSNSITNHSESNPYMGEMKSKDIGTLPYAGRLGGEMVRRMIKAQEEKLMETYASEHMK